MRFNGWIVGLMCVALGCGSDDSSDKNTTTTETGDSTTDTTTPTTTVTSTGTANWVEGGVVDCVDPSERTVKRFVRKSTASNPSPAMIWAYGAGIGVGDIDGNGWDDIVVPGPGTGYILYNSGTLEFTSVALPYDHGQNSGVSLADYDLDGDLDIFVTRFNLPDRFLRNDGNHQFVDVAVDLGMDGGDTHSTSSAWADMDADGDLDLVVAGYGYVETGVEVLVVEDPGDPTRLYENLGNGTFAEVGQSWIPEGAHSGYSFMVSWTELNGDNLPDLLFVNDFPQSGFLGGAAINMGDHFESQPSLGLSIPRANMGLGIGDTNGDGVDDFVITAWGHVNLLESSSFGVWVNATTAKGIDVNTTIGQKVGWAAQIEDMDNDTDMDILVGFGYTDGGGEVSAGGTDLSNPQLQPDAIYESDGAMYTQTGSAWGLDATRVNRSKIVADLNRDGWLDVVNRDVRGVTDILMAHCGVETWLEFRLHQETANPAAIGAKIKVTVGDQDMHRVIRSGTTGLGTTGSADAHFGLGSATMADTVQITWPDGQVDIRSNVTAKQVIDVYRSDTL